MKSNNDVTSNSFALHRTIAPYSFLIIIFFLLTISWIPYFLNTHDWGPFEAMSIPLCFFSLIIYMGTRYQILWHNNSITRRAAGFGKYLTTFKIEDVERVQQETSDLHTILKLNRPLRRITIYGKTPRGMDKIDVSLKHFKLDDVRKLMKLIHERRPDLAMPEKWI